MLENQSTGEALMLDEKKFMHCFKPILWLYVFFAVVLAFFGGVRSQSHLFIIAAIFSALIIYQNAAPKEEREIAWTMVVYSSITAVWLAFLRPGENTPAELTVATWITYKLLFVFVIPLMLPTLVTPWVNTPKRRDRAVYFAFLAVFGLAMFIYKQKYDESHTPIQCESVAEITKTCMPKVEVKSWYTFPTVVEDIIFGLQVTLLVAAFSFRRRQEDTATASVNSK